MPSTTQSTLRVRVMAATSRTGWSTQGSGHVLGLDGLSPGGGQHGAFQTAGTGDFHPALAELAGFGHQHFLTGGEQVVDGGGHGAAAGAGQGQDGLRGAEKLAQVALYALHDFLELALAVVDHVLGQSKADFFGQGRGAGGQEAFFVEHDASFMRRLRQQMRDETFEIGRLGHGSMHGMVRTLSARIEDAGLPLAAGGGLLHAGTQGLGGQVV